MRLDPRSGFTLVEVLATLVITAAFCAVVLPFAARMTSRWWWGETRVETADAWMQAIARLSDDLAQVVPLPRRQGEVAVASFAVGANFVQFVRPALANSPTIGLETVRFEIRSGADGETLIRRAGRYRPEASELGAPVTILSGRFRLRFRAFGEDRVPRDAWFNEPDTPVGVELSVSQASVSDPPCPILLPIVAKTATRRPVAASPASPP